MRITSGCGGSDASIELTREYDTVHGGLATLVGTFEATAAETYGLTAITGSDLRHHARGRGEDRAPLTGARVGAMVVLGFGALVAVGSV